MLELDETEREVSEVYEVNHIAPIGLLRMGTLPVEPEIDQVHIVVRLRIGLGKSRSGPAHKLRHDLGWSLMDAECNIRLIMLHSDLRVSCRRRHRKVPVRVPIHDHGHLHA